MLFIIGFLGAISGSSVLLFVNSKDDERAIQKEVSHIHASANILEINILEDNRTAIVIYEWGRSDRIAVMELRKSLFSWEMVAASSERLPLSMEEGVLYREFSTHTVILGRFFDYQATDITVSTTRGNEELPVTIIEENTYELRQYWYLIEEKDQLTDPVVKLYSENGKKINEVGKKAFKHR
jgi:hypothetical protein